MASDVSAALEGRRSCARSEDVHDGGGRSQGARVLQGFPSHIRVADPDGRDARRGDDAHG
eukprot:scaffold273_cov242-Pinguiococcus_pyrenoidosus.AAC.38